MARTAKRKNAFKWQVRKRVRKALKKYVRGNPGRRTPKRYRVHFTDGKTIDLHSNEFKGGKRTIERALQRARKQGLIRGVQSNPPRVKGRKVKGGRSVTLRNFTGTIVRKSDGRVEILGRGRKK